MRAGAMTSAAAAGRNTTTNTQRLPSMREAGEVANYATTLNQLAEVLTALRKVARDSEILMEQEEKA